MATITRRNNSYLIRVSMGYTSAGKQNIKSMTYKPSPDMTKHQADKEAKRQAFLFEDACMGGNAAAISAKFKDIADEWLQNEARLTMKSTTYNRMLQLRKRIYPELGHLKFSKINTRMIQSFITDLALNGKNLRTGKPISSKTATHHLTFISDVYNYAIRMDMINNNPARRVIVPKKEAKDRKIYTMDEVRLIFKHIKDEPLKYQVFITLAIYGGFRRSELLGLEWKDIDFQNNIISVRRTSQYTNDRGIYTDTTKTKKSQRSIKFDADTMSLLLRYKYTQDFEAKQLGSLWNHTDRLFTKLNGLPMNNGTPYGWFKEFCLRHGLPVLGIHSLRHLTASTLIYAGIDVAEVSRVMGHSQISTTLNIYSHPFAEAQARASKALSEAFDFTKQKSLSADISADKPFCKEQIS